ncbi:bacteriophage T4 gp5 trimerisation domain-containing protein, partial [Vibrio rhizosphaerae]
TGFNELSFEDQSGSEKIYLHAQKDYEALVENDSTTQIKHDRHLTVENDRYSHVQVNDHLSIDGEQRTAIKQNLTLETDASLHQKVGQKTIVDSGSEVHLKAGNAVVLDAGNEITVKVGGSFIKVDAGGVHVVSGAINLNSGGSAGSGSGYAGQLATMPNLLTALTAPEEAQALDITATQTPASPAIYTLASPKNIQAPAFEQVSMQNTPMSKMCQRQPDGSCPRGDCPCTSEA